MRIGIDLMGSDNRPHFLFSAVLEAAACLDASFSLLVIATKSVVEQIAPLVKAASLAPSQASIRFHEVADTIAMGDDPLGAVRRKKGSSLVVGMRLLKKRNLDAFVSCGNTGALITSAALSLPLLPGISRPALLATLPTEKGSIVVVDIGSTVTAKARYLIQFARMGAAYHRAVNGRVPSVGLLNVGVESKKGTAEVRQAYELLMAQNGASAGINFVGNIEGRDVFKGDADVLVTDGFTGNVLIKAAEGVASLIFASLDKAVRSSHSSEFKESLDRLHRQFNYVEHPGALVCGVEGIVVKVHGVGSSRALCNGIVAAAGYAKDHLIERIKQQLYNSP